MSSPDDRHLNNIKKNLEHFRSGLDNCSAEANYGLAALNLSRADQALLEAKKAKSGNKSLLAKERARAAELFLQLAQKHLHNPNCAEKASETRLTERASQYIYLLGKSIIEFKTLVEWKNFSLDKRSKELFIETAELHEDALNQMRFSKMEAAEDAAVGGLLLLTHVSQKCAEENHAQLELATNSKDFKLCRDASAILASISELSRVHDRVQKQSQNLKSADHNIISQSFRAAETAVIASISQYSESEKEKSKKSLLGVQTEIGKINKCLLQISHLEQNDSYRDEQAVREVSQEEKQQAFAEQLNLLQTLLKDRVDDAERLSLRVMSAKLSFGNLRKAAQSGNNDTIEKNVRACKNDLTKLQLLFFHARLFKEEES